MPTLRSATNTPTKKASAETTPSNTPTKKCKTCQRPRLGHPRSGCPFGPPETNENESPDDVSQALSSLNLTSTELELEDTKAAIRGRRRVSFKGVPSTSSESLASLSTTSSQIVAALAKPGIFDNDAENAEGKVLQWQIENFTPKKRPSRKEAQTLMPCTFATPNASYASLMSDPPPSTESMDSTASLARDTTVSRPVTRTMSMEEQAMFIDSVREMSKASAYHLTLDDIPAIQAKAMKVNLYSHVVHIDDPDATEGVVVIGRDSKAVQTLVEQLQADAKKHIAKGGKASGFRAAAGGAVVGAAATFAGLAFS